MLVANLPAPGSYPLQPAISPKGSYYLSKFKSSGVRTFGHSQRSPSQSSFRNFLSNFPLSNFSLDNVPGPGSYRLPSDFGYYESKFSKNAGEGSVSKSPEK